MWLLNTTSLNLHFFVQKIPRYAILSHRWEEQEVSLRQFADANMVQWSADEDAEDTARKAQELEKFPYLMELLQYRRNQVFSMKGMQKITRFCGKAKSMGYDWGWVDTCCIDKSSSAELQEAINSMWKWYQDAKLCIVYMRDVTKQNYPADTHEQFRASEWFKRGWTLQELLAPSSHRFVDSEWESFGTKQSLCDHISAATGIPPDVLINHDADGHSIGDRMSWAAARQTTREEDKAYCLIGLFHVSMPLLYGEGEASAFSRLQLEILKSSTDETIFVSEPLYGDTSYFPQGLLATTPAAFANSAMQRFDRDMESRVNRNTFESTTMGLRIQTPLLGEYQMVDRYPGIRFLYQWDRLYSMPLRCTSRASGKVIFLALVRLPGPELNRFVRVGHWYEDDCAEDIAIEYPPKEIYVSLTLEQADQAYFDFDAMGYR